MTDTQAQSPRDMIAKYVAARLNPWGAEVEEFNADNPAYHESYIWADDILQLIVSQDLGDVVAKETFDAAFKEWQSQLGQLIEQARTDAETARLAIMELEEERDQAILHDRQPYPTSWAYEQACRTIRKHRIMHEESEAQLRDVHNRIRKLADNAHEAWQTDTNGHAAPEHKQYRDQLYQLLVTVTPER